MIAGATPIRASVSAKVLRGPATAISHAPTRPNPPARTCPSMAAITGSGDSTMARNNAVSSRALAAAMSKGAPPLASLRSAPAQKVPPVCPSTTARTAGSDAASRSPWCNWLTRAIESALRLCGEFSVSRANGPPAAGGPAYSTSVSISRASVASGQAQRGLRDEVQHHLPADRGNPAQPGRRQHGGDAVFLGQPVAAHRLHGLVDRAGRRFGGGVLGHV